MNARPAGVSSTQAVPSPSLDELERPQEIDDVLLLLSVQPVEMFDDLICLALAAPVIFDGLYQIVRPPVMRDAVGKISSHVMDEQIGPEMRRLIGKRRARGRRGAGGNHLASGKRRRVAVNATDRCEKVASIHNGRRVWRRSGRSQH